VHYKRAELSVNSTDHFSKGPLGSGNIPKIPFETARCHLRSQSSGLDGSGVMDRCCAVRAPGRPAIPTSALTRETCARMAVGSFRALGGGWTP